MKNQLRITSQHLRYNWKKYLALLALSLFIFQYVTTHTKDLHIYKIGDTKLYIEEVSTKDKLEKGLMYRKHLKANHGMLFIFPKEMVITMWMKNTYIPLDIIFLDSELKVVKIHKNAQPHDLNQISSISKARYALEINALESNSLNLNIGESLIKIK